MMESKKIRKGIVVDVLRNKHKVIVLMPDGEMQKVKPHRLYEIGEEISFREEIVIKRVLNRNRVIRYASALCIAFILFIANIFFPVFDSNHSKDVYAEVFIESKSDVQVKLNKEQEVVAVNPLNKPGTRVVNNLDPEGEPVDNFIDDYFEEMKNEGYMGAEDKAIISVVSDENIKTRNDVLKKVKKAINNSVFIKANGIEVLTVLIPDEIANKADRLGVTPGKYAIAMIAGSTGERNTLPLSVLKLVTATELIDVNPEAAKILSSYSEDELVALTEQHKTNDPVETGDEQRVAMTSSASNQTGEETAEKTTSNTNEAETQTGAASSNKQSKSTSIDTSAKDQSNSSGNSQSESRPEQTPPPKGNEESKAEGQENTGEEKPAEEANPPSDEQPADSITDPDKNTEQTPAEEDKENQTEDKSDPDKNPTVLDQFVSLVLKIKCLES